MQITPNLRIFVCGKTQSGKTTLCRKIMSLAKNIFIYDVKHQYSDFGAVFHSIDALRSALLSGVNRFIYQPDDLSPEHFDEVCKFIFFNLSNILFVVEEVHIFVSKFKIPEYFNRLLTLCQGENNEYASNIGVLSISQRPANVHNDVITQSTIIIAFKLHPSDADALKLIPSSMILDLLPFYFVVFDDRLYKDNVYVHGPI